MFINLKASVKYTFECTCWEHEKEETLTGTNAPLPPSHICPFLPLPHRKASHFPPISQSSGFCIAQFIICTSMFRSHLVLSWSHKRLSFIAYQFVKYNSDIWKIHEPVYCKPTFIHRYQYLRQQGSHKLVWKLSQLDFTVCK